MFKCVYKGRDCEYATEEGYCDRDYDCIDNSYSEIDNEIDDYLDFDLFDEE